MLKRNLCFNLSLNLFDCQFVDIINMEDAERSDNEPSSVKFNPEGVQIVELYMMDKRLYFPLAACSGFAVRTIIYPISLVRTRLQIQKHRNVYMNTHDAFRKIIRNAGVRGLYDGFLFNNIAIISQTAYIYTYEYTRENLLNNGTEVFGSNAKFAAGFGAGFCASTVSQFFQVPIDIVNQHLQMKGINRVKGDVAVPKARFGHSVLSVVKDVYSTSGILGFYRGFFVSTSVFAPSSACWWTLYPMYTGILDNFFQCGTYTIAYLSTE